jgi:hypothetical protein
MIGQVDVQENKTTYIDQTPHVTLSVDLNSDISSLQINTSGRVVDAPSAPGNSNIPLAA